MAFGIGFFFGFDNTPSQLAGDLTGPSPSYPAVPSPSAPPAEDNQATLSVRQALRRQELARKTIQSTVHAGNGGWSPPQAPGIGAWPAVTGGRRG